MLYGSSSYSRNGEVEGGFVSQKHFIGLYILCTDVGKGAIRYSKPERIDFEVVKRILRGTVKSTGSVC